MSKLQLCFALTGDCQQLSSVLAAYLACWLPIGPGTPIRLLVCSLSSADHDWKENSIELEPISGRSEHFVPQSLRAFES